MMTDRSGEIADASQNQPETRIILKALLKEAAKILNDFISILFLFIYKINVNLILFLFIYNVYI